MDISQKTKIGVGMVGTGFMCRAHSNAFSKIRYTYWDRNYYPVLAGVAGSTLEKASEAAERYGYGYACTGWDTLLSDKNIRLVDVCTGDTLHKQVVLEAAAAGKDILCEKPLALSVRDAKEMCAALSKYKVRGMCGFNYRFFPAVLLARTLIERGTLGKLYSFSGNYNQDAGADNALPAEKVWYVTGSKSSGVSYGVGSHLIDISRFLMGEVASVSGLLKTYNTTRSSAKGPVAVKTDEEMLAIVEFENGATGTYKASGVYSGKKNQLKWEVYGSGGSISFDTDEPNMLNVYLKDSPILEVTGFTKINVTQADKRHPLMDVFWPRGLGIGWEDAHVNEIAHLLDCMANGLEISPVGAVFEDGCRAIAIIEAIRESTASGRKIFLEY